MGQAGCWQLGAGQIEHRFGPKQGCLKLAELPDIAQPHLAGSKRLTAPQHAPHIS